MFEFRPRTVWVHADRFVSGALPPVCAKTGRPTTGVVELRTRWQDDLRFVPFSGLVAVVHVVMWRAAGRTAALRGAIPMSAAAHRAHVERRRRTHRAAVGLAALVGLVLTALDAADGSLTGSDGPERLALIWFGTATAAALGARWWIRRGWVRLRLGRDPNWVRLSGVHPDFAEPLLEERERRRRTIRQAARRAEERERRSVSGRRPHGERRL